MRKIKAMILAAGEGLRIRPLTQDLPKPMIPILGKPVIEYLVQHLVRYGITDIMINVGYKHWRIENHFGNGAIYGANIGYSYEGTYKYGEVVPQALGSAGGMRKIQDFGNFFDTTSIVICGDALIDLDFKAAIDEHRHKKALVSIVTKEVEHSEVSKYGVVETDEQDLIVSFQEKPSPDEARSNCISTGIYIVEPELLDYIPPNVSYDLASQLFPLMVEQGLPFYAQKHSFQWLDIGHVSGYWDIMQRILQGDIGYMTMPGTEVRPNIWVGINTCIDWDDVKIEGPVYIGSNVCLEPGVEIIGPAWISWGAFICQNSKVIRSVLFEYTHIPKEMLFDETIVSPSFCVMHQSGETYYAGDDRCELRWGDSRGR